MRIIGLDGGHTVYELGPVSDVVLFFRCLSVFAEASQPEKDWGLLTDRLYKRYLRIEELDQAASLMGSVKIVFASLPISSVGWDIDLLQDCTKTWLDINNETLADVFSKYFDIFIKAKNSATSFLDNFGVYQPVKIVPSDMPLFMIEKERSLADYDNLKRDDLPFWLC